MIIRRIRHFDPEAICESGQCFRMRSISPGQVEVLHTDKMLLIESLGDEMFTFHCTQEDFDSIWIAYFDLDVDYAFYQDAVDKADDYLLRAARWGIGLRILNQDPWEMLVSFILSQRKSIPAIRDGIAKLCRRFGAPLDCPGREEHAFPTPHALAEASLDDLLACSLGYRAPYVQSAARAVACGDINLQEMRDMDDAQLMEKLLSIHGVGIKVASCVMLFGFHRLDMAPVDVWIQRVIDQEYGGISPFSKYKGFGGVMQQFMFYDQICQKKLRKGIA